MAALLAQQFQPPATLQQQHLEFSHLRALDSGLKRDGARQQAAAVVTESVAHHLLPGAEIIAVQQWLQSWPFALPLQLANPRGALRYPAGVAISVFRCRRFWFRRPGNGPLLAGPPPDDAAGPVALPTDSRCGW